MICLPILTKHWRSPPHKQNRFFKNEPLKSPDLFIRALFGYACRLDLRVWLGKFLGRRSCPDGKSMGGRIFGRCLCWILSFPWLGMDPGRSAHCQVALGCGDSGGRQFICLPLCPLCPRTEPGKARSILFG